MSGKEALSVAASICAVVGFVAGTAASTVSTGIVYASFAFGTVLLSAVYDSIQEKKAGKYVWSEAMRELSLNDLYWLGGIASVLFVAIIADRLSDQHAWDGGLGASQLMALVLILAGGWVVVKEWTWYQDSRYKKCPECARKVLAEARKCEYCQHRFDVAQLG